jgi:hypothetical protein
MPFPSPAIVPPDAALETRQELFETAWRHCKPEAPLPGWAEFLLPPGRPCTPDFVFLLVQTDIEFRIKAGRAALLAESYFGHPRLQLPDAGLDGARQVELIRWEYQQRWKRGDRVTRGEYGLAGEPVSAWQEPWRVRAGRWVKRHRTLVTSGVACPTACCRWTWKAVRIRS